MGQACWAGGGASVGASGVRYSGLRTAAGTASPRRRYAIARRWCVDPRGRRRSIGPRGAPTWHGPRAGRSVRARSVTTVGPRGAPTWHGPRVFRDHAWAARCAHWHGPCASRDTSRASAMVGAMGIELHAQVWGPTAARLRERARALEAVGFHGASVPDHLAPGLAPPLTACAALADASERLRIGTMVLNNDLRHPAVLAREAAGLADLSGGRFELGLGAGYMQARVRPCRPALRPRRRARRAPVRVRAGAARACSTARPSPSRASTTPCARSASTRRRLRACRS